MKRTSIAALCFLLTPPLLAHATEFLLKDNSRDMADPGLRDLRREVQDLIPKSSSSVKSNSSILFKGTPSLRELGLGTDTGPQDLILLDVIDNSNSSLIQVLKKLRPDEIVIPFSEAPDTLPFPIKVSSGAKPRIDLVRGLPTPDDDGAIDCSEKTAKEIYAKGSTSVRFSTRQFPEVVRIESLMIENGSPELCSGTVVGTHWILTAAHCVTPESSSANANKTENAEKDYVWDLSKRPAVANQGTPHIRVELRNSQLPDTMRNLEADFAYAHKDYVQSVGFFTHDVALIHVPDELDANLVPHAFISPVFNKIATAAGYGYNNLTGQYGKFLAGLTPELMQAGSEFIIFKPKKALTAFCQGDSGGPLFSGLTRGCRPDDPAKEARPRRVQGVISNTGWAGAADAATACELAPQMVAEDVTSKELSAWLCGVSNGEVDGCLKGGMK
ncbi:exported hypothetical protein [Mesorhizobium sp. ORS 3324]|nr:exported hypothetical protein [Mesorhizobium sp. ORS 3324]